MAQAKHPPFPPIIRSSLAGCGNEEAASAGFVWGLFLIQLQGERERNIGWFWKRCFRLAIWDRLSWLAREIRLAKKGNGYMGGKRVGD